MTKKRHQQMRRKHVPQRTCVACRQVRPKRELIRIVRLPAGEIEVDETGKKSGRGAYLCPDKACWETALTKRYLEHALKTEMEEEDKGSLWQHSRSLPATSA
jgi:predicted RNA-binding protein YlxR (DUF448 family)